MVSDDVMAAIEAPKKNSSASKIKTPSTHPPYLDMIQKGIIDMKERGGSSRQAILKFVMANYDVGDQQSAINVRVKTALKNGVKLGSLAQAKGTGASGSFRLSDGKRRSSKPTKTTTKPGKTSVKPKRKTSVKSPKKVKKPKAAKRSKSASPRKTKKTVKSRKSAKSPRKTKSAKPKRARSPKKKVASKSRRA